MTPTKVIERSLQRIQARWYADQLRLFFRDRRALLAALTWPAAQLRERGVPIRVAQYASMLEGILAGIEQHGAAARDAEYFPGYLTRCVQSHWQHHWEDYYESGKRLRGTYERMVAGASRHAAEEEDRTAEILAAANALCAKPTIRKKREGGLAKDVKGAKEAEEDQLSLF